MFNNFLLRRLLYSCRAVEMGSGDEALRNDSLLSPSRSRIFTSTIRSLAPTGSLTGGAGWDLD